MMTSLTKTVFYKTLHGKVDADNCPSNSSAALNLEQDVINMDDGLNETMNYQQFNTTESAPEPISTGIPRPISLTVR